MPFRRRALVLRAVPFVLVPTWAFAISLSTFQRYYRLGYWGMAPSLPQTVEKFDQVLAVTFFEDGFEVVSFQEEYIPGLPFFWLRSRERSRLGKTSYRARALCNEDYCHTSRVLQRLFDIGQLNGNKPKLSAESVDALLHIADRARLEASDNSSHRYVSDLSDMEGVIVTARAGERRYHFVAANHGLSLGYSPHYEVLLRQDGQKFTISDSNQFAYGYYKIRTDERLVKMLFGWLTLGTALYACVRAITVLVHSLKS